MGTAMLYITPGHLQLLAPLIVGGLIVYFVRKYFIEYRAPAKQLQTALKQITEKVRGLARLPNPERKAALAHVFSDSPFVHSWQQYEETLHDQTALIEGEARIIQTRSTAPASCFFSAQNLIDTPIRVEYFKHLPGILTGLGIIGTFGGLLVGLYYFDPSGEPEKVQDSLKLLLSGVRDAFFASAFAIGWAMFITNSEKKNLRECYSLLESLTDALDQLFHSGVGEEYLAALVKSSQHSTTQSRELKDSLVADLKDMLQTLLESQNHGTARLADTLGNVYRDSGQAMATQISASIENSFREPLNQIAQSVQTASADQSQQIQKLLQEVLGTFTQKLEGSFGKQFTDMQTLTEQSIQSMQQMQAAFSGLIENLKSTSAASSQAMQAQLSGMLVEMHASQNAMHHVMDEMASHFQNTLSSIGHQGEATSAHFASQLERLFAESEARQMQMAEQMQAFTQNVQQSMGQSQQETMARLSDSVGQLGSQLNSILGSLEHSQQTMTASTQTSQRELHTHTRAVVDELGEQVKGLLEIMRDERKATQRAIELLGSQTERSLQGMQNGAEKMRVAAEKFTHAGESVTKATGASGQLITQAQSSLQALGGATHELAAVVADYRIHRETMQKAIAATESILANAQAEAGMRGQVLDDLKQAAERMQTLNREANQYLEKVNGILGASFESFGTGVERSLSITMGALDAELGKAVSKLAGGVHDLSENIDDLADTVEKAVSGR